MIGKMKRKTMNQDQEEVKKDQQTTEEQVENQEATTEEEIKDTAPVDPLKDIERQLAEMNDKYLRLYAEFDNYRRRTMRERVDLITSASSEMMVSMLPVLDDFDRAVKAFELSKDLDALKEGILLVQSKFKGILTQKGLEEMKSLGEDFNTDLHEAVANVPAEKEKLKGKVLDEIEKGYYLNGKVIRFAKVVVAN